MCTTYDEETFDSQNIDLHRIFSDCQVRGIGVGGYIHGMHGLLLSIELLYLWPEYTVKLL